jgi:RNA polymerase sigma-70 factor (ECF subfamily)
MTASEPLVATDSTAATTSPDEALMDHTRFRAIFEAEVAYVWHRLRELGVPERDLPDVTHDVFITVARRLDDYDASRPIRPWLFGIARRVAADYAKLARNRREHLTADGDPDAVDERPGADHALAARDTREVVLAALDRLDHDHRIVLVMHDVDEFTVPEIADELAIPLATGYSRLRNARLAFKAALERLLRRRGDP